MGIKEEKVDLNQKTEIEETESFQIQHTSILGINDLVITELKRIRLNMDHLFILDSLYNNLYELLDIYDDDYSNERVLSLYLTLQRKGYIIEDPNMVTHYIISVDGKNLFEKLLSYSQGKVFKGNFNTKKTKEESFMEWWNLYPLNSKWKDSLTGKDFYETRALRIDKTKCKAKYDQIINSGTITHIEMINCLKYEVKGRKIESIKTGDNKLAWMKGSLSYLNQEAYMAYLPLTRTNPEYIQDCIDCNGDINISNDEISSSNTEII